jgi:hypothetical protein
MKTVFTQTCKLALLLGAALSFNAWSADAVQVPAVASESIELTNLGASDVADTTAAAAEPTAAATGDSQSPADAAALAKAEGALPRKDGEGTSFSKVGLPGTVSAADFEKPGSPASYRELVLNNGVANRYGNPNAMRRYLAVDRATYQARIGQ